MSDYGIKVGCYVIKNESSEGCGGLMLHIKKTTRKFVDVDTYTYYDNKYTFADVSELNKLYHKCFKKKMVKERYDGGSLYFNNGIELKLTDNNYVGANTGEIVFAEEEEEICGTCGGDAYHENDEHCNQGKEKEVEEQEPLPDDGTAEYDEEEQEVNFYKKEIEKLCPPCHLTKWCDTTGSYTYYLDPEWKANCLNTLTDNLAHHLNKCDGYYIIENITFAKNLLNNNDRLYRSDVILIKELCEVLESKFFKGNRFMTELKVY